MNIRRVEDNARLTGLLARRSLLARQLAQSNLLRARAQIEPEMVARILKEVRRRYQTAPDAGTILLDRLIGYLRLALHRDGKRRPSVSAELTLLRAYAALREAETGISVPLQVTVPEGLRHAPLVQPFFSIAKHFLDVIGGTTAPEPRLLVTLGENTTHVAFETGAVALSEALVAQLQKQLSVPPGSGESPVIFHDRLETGAHRYVVQAPRA